MMSKFKASLILALSTVLVLANPTLQVHEQRVEVVMNGGDAANARSSGGRVRSGSFSSGSRSSGSSNSGSRSSGSSNSRPAPPRTSAPSYSTPSRSSQPYNPPPRVVPVPVPVNPGYNSNQNSAPANSSNSSSTNSSSSTVSDLEVLIFLLIVLVFLGISLAVFVLIVRAIIKAIQGASRGHGSELDNERVTVTKLQVALLANGGKALQAQLSQASTEIDTETPEGRLKLLQEAVLALLRSPESWSYVLTESETIEGMDAAQTRFEKLSIEERSKFSAETLVKVHGKVHRQTVTPDLDDGPAAYVVITLLMGTANDKPLFEEVNSAEQLEKVLIGLGALSADYLMVFELLWSPQDESDSLTYDELLTEYTNMRPLA